MQVFRAFSTPTWTCNHMNLEPSAHQAGAKASRSVRSPVHVSWTWIGAAREHYYIHSSTIKKEALSHCSFSCRDSLWRGTSTGEVTGDSKSPNQYTSSWDNLEVTSHDPVSFDVVIAQPWAPKQCVTVQITIRSTNDNWKLCPCLMTVQHVVQSPPT